MRDQPAIVSPRQVLAPGAVPTPAQVLVHRGMILLQGGDDAGAHQHFLGALAHEPGNADALNNLGLCAIRARQYEAAVAYGRRVAAVRPSDAGSRSNLGNVLWRAQRFDEALPELRRAVELDPGIAGYWHNLGLCCYSMGRHAESLAAYRRALAIDPGNLTILADTAFPALAADLRTGWEANEVRWATLAKTPAWECGAPEWRGEDLTGRSIMVHGEQGYGDILQFVRFCADLQRRGALVTFAAPSEMRRLLAGQGLFGAFVPIEGSAAVKCDFHAPLLSLPRWLGVGWEEIAGKPYLAAEAMARPEHEFCVGIVWAPGHQDRERAAERTMRLADFLGLAAHPAVRLCSLQKPDATAEIAASGADGIVADLARHCADWADTARMIASLDCVVAVDTAVAHLAGALGVPCIAIMPLVPCWRWAADRTARETRWYDSMRLVRQTRRGSWTEPLAEIEAAVLRMADRRCAKAA